MEPLFGARDEAVVVREAGVIVKIQGIGKRRIGSATDDRRRLCRVGIKPRLIQPATLVELRSFGTLITNFQYCASPEFTLDIEAPLLGVSSREVTRHGLYGRGSSQHSVRKESGPGP